MVAEVFILTVLPLTTDSMERKSIAGTELLSTLQYLPSNPQTDNLQFQSYQTTSSVQDSAL